MSSLARGRWVAFVHDLAASPSGQRREGRATQSSAIIWCIVPLAVVRKAVGQDGNILMVEGSSTGVAREVLAGAPEVRCDELYPTSSLRAITQIFS